MGWTFGQSLYLFELICSGILIGSLQAFLGLGGAIIAVPLLVFLFGFPIHDATVSSLGIVFISSLFGILPRLRHRTVDFRVALALAFWGIPGAMLGAFLAGNVSSQALKISFALVLFISAFFSATHRPTGSQKQGRWYLIAGLGITVGFMSGFLGVGGGIIAVPALMIFFRMPIALAAGTSLLIVLINSTSALASHFEQAKDLDWTTPGGIGLVAAITSVLMAKVARATKPKANQFLLTIVQFSIGAAMLAAGILNR